MYKRALAAGAKSTMEVMDQFYGDRSGGVKDASGNTWWISTHKEDLSQAAVPRRPHESHGPVEHVDALLVDEPEDEGVLLVAQPVHGGRARRVVVGSLR